MTPRRFRAGLYWRSLILIVLVVPALQIPASFIAPTLLLEPDLFWVVVPWQLYPGSAP